MKNTDLMWSVHYIRTNHTVYFECEEDARIRCFECEGVTPVSIRQPKYGEDL